MSLEERVAKAALKIIGKTIRNLVIGGTIAVGLLYGGYRLGLIKVPLLDQYNQPSISTVEQMQKQFSQEIESLGNLMTGNWDYGNSQEVTLPSGQTVELKQLEPITYNVIDIFNSSAQQSIPIAISSSNPGACQQPSLCIIFYTNIPTQPQNYFFLPSFANTILSYWKGDIGLLDFLNNLYKSPIPGLKDILDSFNLLIVNLKGGEEIKFVTLIQPNGNINLQEIGSTEINEIALQNGKNYYEIPGVVLETKVGFPLSSISANTTDAYNGNAIISFQTLTVLPKNLRPETYFSKPASTPEEHEKRLVNYIQEISKYGLVSISIKQEYEANRQVVIVFPESGIDVSQFDMLGRFPNAVELIYLNDGDPNNPNRNNELLKYWRSSQGPNKQTTLVSAYQDLRNLRQTSCQVAQWLKEDGFNVQPGISEPCYEPNGQIQRPDWLDLYEQRLKEEQAKLVQQSIETITNAIPQMPDLCAMWTDNARNLLGPDCKQTNSQTLKVYVPENMVSLLQAWAQMYQATFGGTIEILPLPQQ
ncbi:MAG: hypothetical protein QXE31_02795 [Candidatus Woesearchaeota archaeon]